VSKTEQDSVAIHLLVLY